MKLLITFLFLITFTHCVSAANATPSSGKGITDLMYFPENDVNYLMSGVKSYSQENIGKQALTGNIVSTLETDRLNAHVTYGRNLIDDIFFTAAINYDLNSDKTTTTGSTSQKTESGGFSEPVFEIKYRALKEDIDKLIFDYKLALSPKLGAAETASLSQDGNHLRGGNEARAGIEIGRRFLKYSLAVEASFTYTAEREVTKLLDNSTTRVKNKMDYVMRVKAQYNFDENLFFRGALSFNSLGDYDERTDTTTTAIAYDTSATYYLTVGYKLNADTALNLEYINNSVDRDVSQSGNLTNQEIKTSSINAFVQYQFE